MVFNIYYTFPTHLFLLSDGIVFRVLGVLALHTPLQELSKLKTTYRALLVVFLGALVPEHREGVPPINLKGQRKSNGYTKRDDCKTERKHDTDSRTHNTYRS